MSSWNSDHSSLLPIPGRAEYRLWLSERFVSNSAIYWHFMQCNFKPLKWGHAQWHPLTDADIPGFLGNLHLHIPAETLSAFPAVSRPRDVKVVPVEALVDGGDCGGRDRGGGCVGLTTCAAGCGRHRVRLWSVLLGETQMTLYEHRAMKEGRGCLLLCSLIVKLGIFCCFILGMGLNIYLR